MAWDSVYESEPTNSTYVADTDDSIRNLKVDIRARVAKEHGFNLTESGAQIGHGKHLRGSARAFVSDTSVADPSTVVSDDGNYSTGRLQVYPTLKRLGYYSGSAWVDLIRNSSGQLFSEVDTGTAPLVVASTTQVANLKAQYAGTADLATLASNASKLENHATGESDTTISNTSETANVMLVSYASITSATTLSSMLVGEMRLCSGTIGAGNITLPATGGYIVLGTGAGRYFGGSVVTFTAGSISAIVRVS